MGGELVRIFGDFNSFDVERRVRLNSVGSLEDIRKLGARVMEGLRVPVDSGDFEAEGILEFEAGIWRARILWQTATDKSSPTEGESR